jgi:hypothetical protein
MRPFDEEGVFGPKTLAILSRAYKEACRELPETTSDLCAERAIQQVVAKRIIDRARIGERDPNRLKIHGLRGLIRSR